MGTIDKLFIGHVLDILVLIWVQFVGGLLFQTEEETIKKLKVPQDLLLREDMTLLIRTFSRDEVDNLHKKGSTFWAEY